MKKNKIILKAHYYKYAFYQPFGQFRSFHQTKAELNAFGTQSAICISSDNIENYVWFGISNDIFNTRKIWFKNSATFLDSQDYSQITEIFDFDVNNNCFIYQGHEYKNITLLFQWCLGNIYTMIYSTRRSKEVQSMGEDLYGDDVLYIHGIWEVELTDNLKHKIFG